MLLEGRTALDGAQIRSGVSVSPGHSRPWSSSPALTLEEHILIGIQAKTRTNLLAACFGMPSVRRQEKELRSQIHKGFGPFGDRLTSDRYSDRADSLSYANRRRLEIARALAAEPEVLLLDEPAAGMNPHERAQLTTAIGQLRDQGQTILLIEHHMELVMSISDRVVALDHGQKIAEGTPREVVDYPLLWRHILAAEPAEPILELRDVTVYYGNVLALGHIDIRIARGDLVSLLGGNASGKTTTMKTVLGVVRPTSGEIRIAGEPSNHSRQAR